jgi:hypothetical protein
VLDRSGRLVAHPDISLVLRGDDDPAAARLKDLQKATIGAGGETADALDAEGRSVIAAIAPISGPDWMAFVEQPASEALGPIRAALWRTGLLLLAGAAFAALLAYLLARRMARPIRLLEQGPNASARVSSITKSIFRQVMSSRGSRHASITWPTNSRCRKNDPNVFLG